MKKIIRKQMNDQQRAMVVENMKYADKIARNYLRGGILLDDLEQEAREALCYAAMRYDPDKGCSLATFATVFINGCLSKYVMRYCENSYLSKQQRFFVRVLSLEQLCSDNDDMNWENAIADTSDNEYQERQEMYDMLDYVMANLTADERTFVSKQMGFDCEGLSINELSKQLGVERKTIQRRSNEIQIKMAELAEKYIVEHNN